MAGRWRWGGAFLGRLCWAGLLYVLTLSAVMGQEAWNPGDGTMIPAGAFTVLTGLRADTPYEAVAERLSREGQRPEGRVLSAGLTWDKFWAVAEVHNDSAQPGIWQVRTPLVAAGELDILVIRPEGAPEVILSASFRDGFSSRPVAARQLISAPFALAPGETARLAVGYRPLGFSRLPLWVASPEATQAYAADLARGDAVFYTATGVLIACFLGFCLVIRNRAGMWFAGLLVANLAVVAQIEGQLFRYLWPHAPLFNLNATLPLILLAAGIGYLSTLQAGRGSLGPVAIRVLWGAVVLCALHLSAVPFAHPALTVPGGMILWIGSFAAILVTLIRWTRFTRAQRRIGQGVAGGMLVVGILWLAGALRGDAPGWMTSDMVLRLAYLWAGGGLMALLLMQVSGLYRAHQDGLQAQIAAARTEADLNAALLASERSYSEALRRAATAGQRLATASHDIQQPLTALRLLLRQPASDNTTEAMADALGYLDHLAGAFSNGDDPGSDTPAETYDLSMILNAVADMFRDEAAAAGIDLRVTAEPAETTVPTLSMMRILSNLTVNAIRHSGGRVVTLSLCAGSDGAQISVTNDGATLTAAEFVRYQTRGVKGSGSDGDGLGLAIISDLCAQNGLTLSLDDTLHSGTRLIVNFH